MEKYLFSYATPDDPPIKRSLIRIVEKVSGQPKLKKLYLENQRAPRPSESFWQAAVRSLDLDVRFDPEALARAPASGPLVIVANHPYGVLDGIVIAWLASKIRNDFVVLTNAVLMRTPEVRNHILPINFSGTREARNTNVASRASAREVLGRGGIVVVFPAGGVSTAPDRMGRRPAVDARWQPFVAQLIQKSEATVLPIWFDGQNSRLFQVASHLSATLRLSLIFHEVRARMGTTLGVMVGRPIPFCELSAISDRQVLADHLRAVTYALSNHNRSVDPESALGRGFLRKLKRLSFARAA